MRALVALALVSLALAVPSPTAGASVKGPVVRLIGCDTGISVGYFSTTSYVSDWPWPWAITGHVTGLYPCGGGSSTFNSGSNYIQVNRWYYPVGWRSCGGAIVRSGPTFTVTSVGKGCQESGWPAGFTAYVTGQSFSNGTIAWGAWAYV